jgi:hypothetical protein
MRTWDPHPLSVDDGKVGEEEGTPEQFDAEGRGLAQASPETQAELADIARAADAALNRLH